MKNMKKFVSLLLAVVMVMAMTMTTFAAEEPEAPTSNLNIETKLGHTYKVYQMLVGDVSGLTTESTNNTQSGTLANVILGTNNNAATVDVFETAVKNLSGAELGDKAAEFIKGDPVEIEGTGSSEGITVADGYYIIVDTFNDDADFSEDGANTGEQLSRYVVTVIGDTTIKPKDSTNDIDKEIVDTDANAAIDESKKTDTAAIGDTINYKVTGNVPEYTGYKYYYYVVKDTMSKGLTLDEESFEVKVGDDTLTEGEDYYVYVTNNEDGTTSFELAFEDMVGMEYPIGAAITITYDAKVNEYAEIGKEPNTNTVKLQYSNNPSNSERHDSDEPGKPGPDTVTGETPDRITKTYVTELTLQKTDATEKIFIAALQGAEFTLTGDNLTQVKLVTATTFAEDANGTYYLLKDGTYTEKAPIEASDTTTGNADKYADDGKMYKKTTTTRVVDATTEDDKTTVTVAVDPKTGTITFTGLNAGSYKLEETKVPTGYNKAADITFTITGKTTDSTTLEGGHITWKSDNEKVVLDGTKGVFNTEIENKKGNLLPSTGGMGTTIFYLIGTILVIGAGVLLVTKKRMAR